LKIVGSGPLEPELAGLAQAAGAPVTFLGRRPREEIAGLLARARLAVVPSEWHEPLSIAAVEALAAGVPLLVTPLGGFSELVVDGDTGLHCLPGNPEHLAHRARQLAEDLAMNERMGRAARQLYLQRFTPEQNYTQLLDVYRAAQAVRRSRVRSSWVVRAPQRVV
jgi:glycosyltransferase involved in cell wall biosynthesis